MRPGSEFLDLASRPGTSCSARRSLPSNIFTCQVRVEKSGVPNNTECTDELCLYSGEAPLVWIHVLCLSLAHFQISLVTMCWWNGQMHSWGQVLAR